MADLDGVIRSRKSVRGFFRDRPVPRSLLLEALELAQRAPSNCNVQPWRLFIVGGTCCQRLSERLLEAAEAGKLGTSAGAQRFEGAYRQRQVECAVALYSTMGVPREDKEARRRAAFRNYVFFDAPHAAIVCMDRSFGIPVALDVGIYLQTLMLALEARGVASCAQGSMRACEPILREQLGIPTELMVLCGLSFGYEDASVPANATRQDRQPLSENVKFLDDELGD